MESKCLAQLRAHGISQDDAIALRRISMTLHSWFELECGNGDNNGSWCIVRGRKAKRVHTRDPETQASVWTGGEFTHDDDGKPFMERHHYRHGNGKDYTTYCGIPDRETGARKRLAKIMACYPGFKAYVQTDPRGCALYILRPDDLKGLNSDDAVSCNYTRGIAVYK